ncbi:hypothetical protein HanXRQr2_Chr04g0171511 [Helianthus annuus]|uniref:Uncharacterized protein n=1 Tax=Helianthus annuus TaxID=4232 RepID=A0A9K3J953_HELAN|nr:hypothetical protein HanXRQr2_Chr04g0171511 [Helianthus annuus]KAJ0931713.1 hypothetical protein HanPSC8_Chr04g0165071 [Helianthus annuus]
MSRLRLTKFIGVLSRDVGTRLNLGLQSGSILFSHRFIPFL